MYVILYRWRIRPGLEEEFVEAWTEVTRYYAEHRGSLGSRLHRGGDGIWYAYAQWPSAEHRERAFREVPALPARERMTRAIAESFPETELRIEADLLGPAG